MQRITKQQAINVAGNYKVASVGDFAIEGIFGAIELPGGDVLAAVATPGEYEDFPRVNYSLWSPAEYSDSAIRAERLHLLTAAERGVS